LLLKLATLGAILFIACGTPDNSIQVEKARLDSLRLDSLEKDLARKMAEADSIVENLKRQ